MHISTDCCTCWAQCIGGVLCFYFQQWSMEHFHTRRPGSGRPYSTDTRRDWCIVWAAVAARTASREEIWTHVTSPVSPSTIVNSLIAAGFRSHVSLARLPLTPWHRQALLLWCCERGNQSVKWCSVVFIDESRFCLYACNGHTLVWHRPGEHHLPECIHPRDTGPTSGFMVWGAISYNSRSHLVFPQDKVNSAPYTVQVVNPVLCQDGDVLYQEDNTCPHAATATQHALHGVTTTVLASKNLRSLTNWTHMEHDEAGTYSFSGACHNQCQIVTMGARFLGQSIGWHSAPLWPFACENMCVHKAGYTLQRGMCNV